MIDWNMASTIIITVAGLIVIFSHLVTMPRMMKKLGDNREVAVPAAHAPAFAPAALQMADSDAEVAAISAAIACYMEAAAPGAAYTIRSVRRVSGERPVWGFAGMLGNTRPF